MADGPGSANGADGANGAHSSHGAIAANGTNGDRQLARRTLVVLGVSLAFVVTAVVVWQSLGVLVLVFAGVLLGLLLTAGRDALVDRVGLPSHLAFFLVTTVFLAAAVLFVIVLLPLAVEQAHTLVRELPELLQRIEDGLRRSALGHQLLEPLPNEGNDSIRSLLQIEHWTPQVVALISGAASLVVALVVTLMLGIYLAAERHVYVRGILFLIPPSGRATALYVMRRLAHVLRWWLVGQSLSMLTLGALTALGLWLMGIPYALALGLLTSVLNIIPNLGPILAGIPTLALALAKGPMTMLYVGIFYVTLQNIEGYLVTPLVHRRIIRLPPFLVLTSELILWRVLGPFGVVVAMPVLVTVLVLMQELYVRRGLHDDPATYSGKSAEELLAEPVQKSAVRPRATRGSQGPKPSSQE